ncbi:unnamed protein product [Cylindrotheca closterium]|uniref:TOG domain-containing protein n=1 Tax=Cylindrotheca closterium TaxID=2856 RepID=A0AAD2FTW4_9STRA|nr:unnamed protein product [Cylindrotheca closterium]
MNSMGGGGNFKQESTFQGENGGDATDAELLALLRGVSAKNASADRFADDDNDQQQQPQEEEPALVVEEPPVKPPPRNRRDPNEVPPWKKGKAKPAATATAPAPAPAPQPAAPQPFMGGGNFKQETNFNGENGGEANDEELLALLRGVSAKSASADRFADDGENDNENVQEEQSAPAPALALAPKPKPAAPSRNRRDPNEVPPWKRGKAKAKPATPPKAEPTPPPTPPPSEPMLPMGGGNFKQESTFNGENGGEANDEELLALLRGVSAKSASADRFADDNDDAVPEPDAFVAAPPPAPAPRNRRDPNEVPPWKQKKNKPKPATQKENEPAPAPEPAPFMAGGNFKQESNFNGENGGEANDEELLALLRGVSAKSASADRFAADDDNDGSAGQEQAIPEPAPAPKPKPTLSRNRRDPNEVPPWKRGKAKAKPTTTPKAEPTPAPAPAPVMGGGNFKQESTFSGENGGDANDEELLALLRGVSAKSSSAARFADDDGGGTGSFQEQAAPAPAPVAPPKPVIRSAPAPSPPKSQPAPVPAPQPAPVMGGGNFKQESTFSGERGGDANDEELLALLRGVSAKTGSSRFGEEPTPPVEAPAPAPAPVAKPPPPLSGTPFDPNPPPTPFASAGGDQDEIVVTREDLPTALSSSDWKVRKKSYVLLSELIVHSGGSQAPTGAVNANQIYPGLDDMIASTCLMEKNANALESAMEMSTAYADYCRGGMDAERAEQMTTSLIKGTGFTSPRPASARVAEALVLKIMEVGSSADSLNAVIGVLMDQGFASRKPKIVQMSCNLILKAAQGFGAACLPLAAISQSMPKLLSHANKKIRDVALEIVAELCRALGSKDPLEEIISKLKKAQEADLDDMLEKQPQPNPPQIGLRCNRVAGGNQAAESPGDALAALQASAKELEAERFAKRPEVDLFAELRQVDYAGKLKLAKWNEKVAGLTMILEAGGETPYKLKQPSSSINYVPLISEMKAILSHTHFAVVSKAMEVLSMLAQGVGAKLYPNLRPLMPKLFQLSKDKKLIKSTSACLDALFGNVISFDHILEEEYAIKEALEERKQKNALARTNALDFLTRCVTRRETAGPRGALDPSTAKESANLASLKLKDTDANVRKAAVRTLKELQSVEDPEIQNSVESVIEELETSNPRVYKQLSGSSGGAPKPTRTSKASPPSSPVKRASATSRSKVKTTPAAPPPPVAKKAPTPPPKARPAAAPFNVESGDIPTTEEAIARCSSLDIPPWETDEDNGDTISGIQSSKWQCRQAAIKGLANFVSNREVLSSPSESVLEANCIVVLVKEHTRGFKESNFNVTKAIMELFLALCDYHEKAGIPFLEWASADAATLATEKIADRKLSSFAKELLSSLCVVRMPSEIHMICYEAIKKIRAPAAHEELAKWIQHFCNEFGAASLGSSVSEAVPYLVEGCKSKNAKVKKESLSAAGLLHIQLGPIVRPVAYTAAGKDDSIRSLLEKTFEDNPHDPSFAATQWPKSSICVGLDGKGDGSDADAGFGLDIPKMDLFAELPNDCIDKMGSKESKTSWKARKAAMEDVSSALKQCNGLLDTTNIKQLVALCRELCERLSDTQSNLKPVAARLLGTVLSLVDAPAQVKLGKVIYAPLINSAMNENKKAMHDAAMEALQKATTLHPIEGEGINSQVIIPFVSALAMVLDESEFKASGLSDVLNLTQTFADDLPNLDNVASQRGETVGGRFATVIVDGLTSPKADIRAASEALLQACVDKEVFDISTAKRSASRLKPAKQRSIGPILARMSALDEPSESQEVEKGTISTRAIGRRSQTTTSRRSIAPPNATTRKTNNNGRGRQQEAVSETLESAHPLIGLGADTGKQKSASAMRLMTWPEYPDEPSANTYFTGLKKTWSPLLPPDSVKVLFPAGGIRRHDDAKAGCDLLKRAIELDKAGEGTAVSDQFGIILKWSVYVLCRKETTAGLQELLSFFSELFLHMMDINHELTDSESGILLPFIWDKYSAAKGRFKDTYMELLDLCTSEALCPPKKLGPLVCVPVLEASPYPHARVLACRECYDCVEKIGLSGIGKRGTLALAKALSEEKLLENRNAYLDLMESLLLRMNGDMQRLARICGSSLSAKARDLLEERVTSGGGSKPTSGTESLRRTQKPRGSPNREIPSPQKIPRSPTFAKNKTIVPRSPTFEPAKSKGVSGGYNSAFGDELPALGLRDSPRTTQSSRLSQGPSSYSQGMRRGSAKLDVDSANDILSNLLDAEEMLEGTGGIARSNSIASSKSSIPETNSQSKSTKLFSVPTQMSAAAAMDKPDSSNSASTEIGAAASLRARLLKIREKTKVTIDTIEVEEEAPQDKFGLSTTFSQETSSSTATGPEKALSPVRGIPFDNDLYSQGEPRERLSAFLDTLSSLIAKKSPLQEDDDDIFATTDVLKTIHAAVSGQANLAVDLSSSDVTHLRVEIADRASDVVAALTRLIGFGFDCHDSRCSAGMSVPLLSVNLASLMAIFRSDDLAKKVAVDDLTLLIREAGKALLDKRLATSSSVPEGSKLDDATSTQMVRAINKLAVQAATGTKRDISFQALIALQQQLSMNAKNSDESMFNSRLSRVIAKLFSRVIKAEEGTPEPYNSGEFDIESILCCLEDSLDATLSDGAGAGGNRNLAMLLMTSMLKARGESFSLRSQMDELGIDSQSSELGKLLTSCATDLGIYPGSPARGTPTGVATRDVSALVSAVGSAQGEEREKAISALRGYTDMYGNADLMEHLEQVSDTFREFILEQLSLKASDVDAAPAATASESMTARIKSLRSKLNGTDSAGQPVAETVPPAEDSAPTVRAFRARLAAAQEKRGSGSSSVNSVEEPATQPAESRAAALRARLQKVKQQTTE